LPVIEKPENSRTVDRDKTCFVDDPLSLAAGLKDQDEAKSECHAEVDSNGQPCVLCSAVGVFDLFLSIVQASTVGQYLDCGKMTSSSSEKAAEVI